MLLVADSGSTKTDWMVLEGGKRIFKTSTAGLNPHFVSKQDIRKTLRSVNFFKDLNRRISEVRFYGAGCSEKRGQDKIKTSLHALFPKAKVVVQTDLAGAAIATCGDTKGIVCILGTGSNCCYYDGKRVHRSNAGLGYVLGDEAGGTYFGKKILKLFLYGKMTPGTEKKFRKQFNVTRESAIDNTYNRPNANRYLASFALFLKENKSEKQMRHLIEEGLNEFFETNISQVKGYKNLPVHFVGSVAVMLEGEIKSLLRKKKMHVGKIIQRPIEGLNDYFKG